MTIHFGERGIIGIFKPSQELTPHSLQNAINGAENKSTVIWGADITRPDGLKLRRTETITVYPGDLLDAVVREESLPNQRRYYLNMTPIRATGPEINEDPRVQQLGKIVGKEVYWRP